MSDEKRAPIDLPASLPTWEAGYRFEFDYEGIGTVKATVVERLPNGELVCQVDRSTPEIGGSTFRLGLYN